jgi:hypothetical protein
MLLAASIAVGKASFDVVRERRGGDLSGRCDLVARVHEVLVVQIVLQA